MVNKYKALLKGSYIHLRLYMLILLAFVAAGLLANFIVYLSMGANSEDNSQVSTGNMLSIMLIIMAVVLPLGFFKKIINLGATRQEYYTGLIVIYTVSAAFFSVLNILILKLEQRFMDDYQQTMNILSVFHWDQFNLLGLFLYQFAVYMLLISFINMLFSGIRSHVGLSLWVIVIAAIPISTSIASYRSKLADGLQTLLFNDSLLAGFGICFTLSCVCLMAGWLFTSRRSF